MNNKNFIIFTDGAFSPNRNQGGSSFIIINNDKYILKWIHPWKGGTNNTAELLAIIYALKAIKNSVSSLTIYSDSMYCIGSINEGWKRNKNQKLWKIFDSEKKRISLLCKDLTFKHIKGHDNSSKYSKWNNLADKYAVFASQLII